MPRKADPGLCRRCNGRNKIGPNCMDCPCRQCGQSNRSKVNGQCLSCKKIASKKYREKHPENYLNWYEANRARVQAGNRRWREANRERFDAAKKKYAIEHAAKLAAARRENIKANPKKYRNPIQAWRAANPDRVKAQSANWRKNNPERYRTLQMKRRARKAGAPGVHTVKEWLELLRAFDGKCAYCGTKDATTRDHILPLIKSGSNDIGNIAPACLSCNSSKKDSFALAWLMTR